MRFITMGSEERPTLLFIHGLSATAESCYGIAGRLLQNNWHILLCELDGHHEGSPAFTSIDAECEQIEDYMSIRRNIPRCWIKRWEAMSDEKNRKTD